MILSEILLVKRVDGYFHIGDYKIKADRVSSSGYGVLLVFEPSKLDKDFLPVIGTGKFAWFPSARALDLIKAKLDLSDRLTLDLRNGHGWKSGPRPFSDKLADMI